MWVSGRKKEKETFLIQKMENEKEETPFNMASNI